MNPLDQPKGIIPWFASNPVAANLLMIVVIVLGILTAGKLNKEGFPDLPPNSIDISVSYDTGSAKENEESVAIPIEQKLQGVEGIKNILSTSTAKSVEVNVEIKDNYKLDDVFDDIKNKIGEISSFPKEADPAVITKASRTSRAILIQVYGNADRQTLQKLTYQLRTDLLANENINSASISGWLDPTMLVEVDKNKLEADGLTMEDITNAINAESSPAQVATLSNKTLYLKLSASEQAYFKTQFAKIPVKTTSAGGQILLGDVANIRDSFKDDSFVLSRFNKENSLAISINSTGKDDISRTVAAAKQIIEKWRSEDRLPPSIHITAWNDRSQSIDQRLELMVKNAITGVILVFILLAIFLNVTVAFWVAMGLPFIFFGTLFIMGTSLVGLTLNLFTTFGFILALGIVVDDAVVVGESIYSVRKKEGDTLGNTIKGTMMVAIPTLFGVFTTVAAFWALSNIEGRLGQLYSQFAIVVAICLILSVIESKVILPAHLAHLNTRKAKPTNILSKAWGTVQKGADNGLQWFSEKCYRPAIDFSLKHRYALLVLFIALFVLVMSMPFTGSIRMSFFPRVPGDTVRGTLTMYSDVSYGQTENALLKVEQKAYEADKQLREGIPSKGSKNQDKDEQNIKSDLSKTALKNVQVTSSGDQGGRFRVELTDDRPYTSRQFANKWQSLSGLPEGVKSLSISATRETVDALYIEVKGNDSSVLNGAMDTLVSKLNSLPAITSIEKFDTPAETRLALNLNEQGRLLGLTTTGLASQVSRNFDGTVVQKYQRDSDEIEVRIGFPKDQQESPAAIMNTKITLGSGERIPLDTVANLGKTQAQTSITRFDGKQSLYLTAEVDKDVMSSTEIVNYLKATVMPNMKKQFAGVDFEFSGEAQEQAETESSISQMFMIALLIIYGLLAIPLKSYIQPVIIMMAIPFGIIGALLGHWMNDLALSIFSLNGILALSGVVVNDSLLLVSRFNEIRKETSHVQQAISQACRGRLRAVLLTSFTTFAGLIPILWETSRQAQMLIPAAVSLGYGIMFATVITLVLIPVLLMIKNDIELFIERMKNKMKSHRTQDEH